MINFLPDIIKTFSDKSQQTVGSLMKNVKADKAQVAELVKNLSTFSVGADYAPVAYRIGSIIESESFVDTFRDMQIRFERYFNASNAVSVSTNSMVDIMLSQIAKIEKNVEYLENYINNYEFISGKDDLYNFSYLENFDNNLNSNEHEVEKVPYTDRGGSPFGENGNGYVDSIVSKFKIGAGVDFINPIGFIKSVKIDSNYTQYISSISDSDNLFMEKHSNVWNVSIKSPTILTSFPDSLSVYMDYDYSHMVGAKTILEIDFIKEIEMDFIRINPNEINGLQLMQVLIESSNIAERLFSSDSNVPSSGYQLKQLLNAPIGFKSTLDITFPMDKVKRIILILNQPLYTKATAPSSSDELNSKIIYEILKKIRKNKKNTHSTLQDIVLEYFRKSVSIDEFKKNINVHTDYYTYKYPIENNPIDDKQHNKFRHEENNLTILDESNLLFDRSPLTNMVQNIVSQTLGMKFKLFKNTMFNDTNSVYRGGSLGRVTSPPTGIDKNANMLGQDIFGHDDMHIIPGSNFAINGSMTSAVHDTNSYQYNFSLKNIQFGKTNIAKYSTNSFSENKASYISARISIAGTVLGIKAKVNLEEIDKKKNFSNLDLKEPISYELSISLKENPISEGDWYPIIPFNSSEIESEILFVDKINQTASLRFYPDEPSIKVYRNQSILNNSFYIVNKFEKTITFKSFDPKSVYIVSYTADTVNFTQNYIDASLISPKDKMLNSGSGIGNNGEFFERTYSGNMVLLKNEPYIDPEKLNSAIYSLRNGTISTSNYLGYSPVAIKFSDGTYAINLTNYIDNNFEKASFYETNEILFFQNGKNIIFNKSINLSFNIMYSYLNNFIRFRLIVRNNMDNIFSAGYIDNVVLKLKTKNMRSNKLSKLG